MMMTEEKVRVCLRWCWSFVVVVASCWAERATTLGRASVNQSCVCGVGSRVASTGTMTLHFWLAAMAMVNIPATPMSDRCSWVWQVC
jgi:hypothetical protein